jgi:hypothetical protein
MEKEILLDLFPTLGRTLKLKLLSIFAHIFHFYNRQSDSSEPSANERELNPY